MSEVKHLKSTGKYQDNIDALNTILLNGGLVGKLATPEEVEKVFEELLQHEDVVFEKLLEFVDTEMSHQDDLYQAADEIIGSSELIDEDDEDFRVDIQFCMDKSLADLSSSLETIFFSR